ncbi:hypothetical protein V8C34DRAFT_289090 [Trichoderma compactum]
MPFPIFVAAATNWIAATSAPRCVMAAPRLSVLSSRPHKLHTCVGELGMAPRQQAGSTGNATRRKLSPAGSASNNNRTLGAGAVRQRESRAHSVL